jgi:hypothetical protein
LCTFPAPIYCRSLVAPTNAFTLCSVSCRSLVTPTNWFRLQIVVSIKVKIANHPSLSQAPYFIQIQEERTILSNHANWDSTVRMALPHSVRLAHIRRQLGSVQSSNVPYALAAHILRHQGQPLVKIVRNAPLEPIRAQSARADAPYAPEGNTPLRSVLLPRASVGLAGEANFSLASARPYVSPALSARTPPARGCEYAPLAWREPSSLTSVRSIAATSALAEHTNRMPWPHPVSPAPPARTQQECKPAPARPTLR